MRSTGTFVLACSAAGWLLVAAGCGSSGEGGADTNSPSTDKGTEGPEVSSPAGANHTKASRVPPKPAKPVVVIKTSLGDIPVELDTEKAPETVTNFLRYAESGFYDRTIFHQVFQDAVILGGMFAEDETEKAASAPIQNEAHNGLANDRGTIAMAREYDVIDSATCGFFINVKDNPNYNHKPEARKDYGHPEDYGYCVFGRVLEEGMPVVDQISKVQVQDRDDFERIPVRTVLIEAVRRRR